MNTIHTVDYKVSGFYLRAWLTGLRRISGQHYPFILGECGLSQFIQKYPAANFNVVASGMEISKLSQTIYDFLGPNAFNLFMINLGREFGRTASTLPLLKQYTQHLSPINTLPALIQFLEFMIEHNHQTVNEHIVLKMTDNPNILQLIYLDCVYCASLPLVKRPACPGIGTFWSQLIFELMGHRLRIEEISCGAVQRNHDCHFLIHY